MTDERFKTRRNDPFWRLINNTHIQDGCWEWQGYRNPLGYGRMRKDGKKHLAHRISYTLFVGEIPEGKMLCHKCDNPSCVNPDHLFVGTNQDNVSDCIAKGRHKGALNSPFVKGHQHARRT